MGDDRALLAWEYEAGMLHHFSGESEEECRKKVMLRWLEKGDGRPVAYMMSHGIAPHPDVLKMLAGMMYEEYTPLEQWPDGQVFPADNNYRIEFRSKRGGKGKRERPKGGSPETDVLDFAIAWRVKEKMQNGLRREDAISEVAEELGKTERHVTSAYNRCSGKRELGFWPITGKQDVRTAK
jgi:hypothetical protein